MASFSMKVLPAKMKTEPNQSPEPTPTAVTTDASASVAPSAGAAHLRRSAKINHHMKHYVLISVQIPLGDSTNEEAMRASFVGKTQKIVDQSKGIRRCHENTWLLDRENAASALAKIVSAAEGFDMKYDIWYLSSE